MPVQGTPIVMIDFFIQPLREDFFLRALVAILLSSITAGCLGAYIVLRRMAFISNALTHSILPGVAAAILLGFSLYWGALGAALVTATGIAWLSSKKEISEDSAIGIMLSFMFAVGVGLISLSHAWRDFTSLLFGSVLAVDKNDLWIISLTTAIILLSLRLLHKELELASFDEEYAQLIGAKPALLRVILLMLIALAAVASVRLVGALLTTALFIIPSATGVLLGKNLVQVMCWGVGVAILSGIAGLYLSFYFAELPSGAAIVICYMVPYLAARLFTRRV